MSSSIESITPEFWSLSTFSNHFCNKIFRYKVWLDWTWTEALWMDCIGQVSSFPEFHIPLAHLVFHTRCPYTFMFEVGFTHYYKTIHNRSYKIIRRIRAHKLKLCLPHIFSYLCKYTSNTWYRLNQKHSLYKLIYTLSTFSFSSV